MWTLDLTEPSKSELCGLLQNSNCHISHHCTTPIGFRIQNLTADSDDTHMAGRGEEGFGGRGPRPCAFFNSPGGCKKGTYCSFAHVLTGGGPPNGDPPGGARHTGSGSGGGFVCFEDGHESRDESDMGRGGGGSRGEGSGHQSQRCLLFSRLWMHVSSLIGRLKI